MEQPMFYSGQQVTCIKVHKPGGWSPLVEGNDYTIANPNDLRLQNQNQVWVTLREFTNTELWSQDQFAPKGLIEELEEVSKMEIKVYEPARTPAEIS